jgi:hypothetical protein
MIGFIFANKKEAASFSQKVISERDFKGSLFHFSHLFTASHTTCSKTRKEEGEERKDRQIYDI